MARYSLEPFDKLDINTALIRYSMYANQGGTRYGPEDFIHKWYRPEHTIDDVDKKIRMFFGMT